MSSETPAAFELPARYEVVEPLGKGGGGEVWAVRDRLTDGVVAFKTLGQAKGAEEIAALVREATALSGLEGLGVPRVLRFGRMPATGAPYLVRELVPGRSLASFLKDPSNAELALLAVARAAAQLTVLHRARLLHGDVKPANIIVGKDGAATLVDLGLVAAFQEQGTSPVGLTLLYAAPELLAGSPLTVRAEVYALGATLRDVLEGARAELDPSVVSALEAVVARATAERPDTRYPSVDELESALQHAVPSIARAVTSTAVAWPILGVDAVAEPLTAHVEKLARGAGIVITGGRGSGRSTLLRRLAWRFGIELAPSSAAGEGRIKSVAWIEARCGLDLERAVSLEIQDGQELDALVLLIDDAELLSPEQLALLGSLRAQGARLIVVANGHVELPGPTLEVFSMSPLSPLDAAELLRRAIPSLPDAVVEHVLARTQCWPGELRALVARMTSSPVVAPEDVDRLMAEAEEPRTERKQGREPVPLEEIRLTLEKGHFEEAAEQLETRASEVSAELAVLRARLCSNRGEWRRSLAELDATAEAVRSASDDVRAEYVVELSRAHLRAGDYAACESAARDGIDAFAGRTVAAGVRHVVARRVVIATIEMFAIGGLGKSFLAKHSEARAALDRAVAMARELGDHRALSIALGSLAFAVQRTSDLEGAQTAYEEALVHAEAAGDAGTVATTRLNLAGVAKARGDLAKALTHLEAAVDMGRRSGRLATLRQALLNLANLDLYLGRLARSRVSIDLLAQDRDELPPQMAAQLYALEAEHAAKSGAFEEAERHCQRCSEAYLALARPVDAAEAILEGVFAALGRPQREAFSHAELAQRVDKAATLLAGATAHRAALELARGRVAALAGRGDEARQAFERAIEAANASGKRDWLARVYQAREGLHRDEGQTLLGRRDREQALALLEEIAAKLPRDLREVFWDEPSRRSLRDAESVHLVPPAQRQAAAPALPQDRLARILEINREIAGTYDLKRLLERVTDHAIALLTAERGFVLLKSTRVESPLGELSIHASRDQAGDDPHARFSQSIAERVVSTGEPIVTTSARDDARMADYVSVHQLMLQSVACVPIRSRSSGTIGALYLETRLRAGVRFSDELPLIVALADQVAIAIETARLVSENERRASELSSANQELTAAQARLEELLGHRTAQLQATRRDLRSARAVLKSHFGYEGLVGTSESMRRVYALIDRIKDTDVPVLITGESGTGKEIVARAIHNASPRARQPFLGLNCGAIPEHLLESELFGHVRGSFTGADRDRRGLFKEATGGTLLLDEIGEMPHKMQAGLLRVLQEKVVRPIGGAKEEPVDTRVIAATHRELESMVERGTFREDLFYRLHVIQVRVPPLRERIEDIPALIDHFLGIFAARYHRERRSVSRSALKLLMAHRWPGNVRQLENALLNAWVLSDGPELEAEDFELSDPSIGAALAAPSVAPTKGGVAPTSLDAHRQSERDRILQALAACNWNRVKASELIGMPRRTFYRRLKDYGIQ